MTWCQMVVAACLYRAFDELGKKRLPTVKALNIEYAELLSAKKKAFTEYTNARAKMREVLTVKANVERIWEYAKIKILQQERV